MSKEQTDLTVAADLARTFHNWRLHYSAGSEERRLFDAVEGVLLSAAPKPSTSTAEAEPVGDIVTELRGLIDAYWGIAYSEGREGRTTDTLDGAAQRTRTAIEARLSALATPLTEGGERNAVIEECATVADFGVKWTPEPTAGSYQKLVDETCAVLARSIRALKSGVPSDA